jgi:hypothetical protein
VGGEPGWEGKHLWFSIAPGGGGQWAMIACLLRRLPNRLLHWLALNAFLWEV